MGYECASECEGDFYDAVESRLTWLTMAAHKQLLFEKIKERVESKEGKKLDRIADLLVEASDAEWANEKDAERKREELREKIRETFDEQ
ncbi:MAG: hypothetical protein HY366_00425 [Candidatus Aenigmarchaeota archaeon]|nr:hypothetical protein [Candidatus Aenigmarchaeota archaeon]